MDYFKVNESDDEYLSKSTSYTFYLTKDDVDLIDNISKRYEYLLKKQKKARSTIIKLIIENTYLYLNNNERYFQKDLNDILEKKYFENMNSSFIKLLKEGNKEYEFILELVRNQLLRLISNKNEEKELVPVQFRLAKDDDRMLRIIAGNKTLSRDEFLSGYLRYFLSLPRDTQKYILIYPKSIKLDRAIKEHKCIIIGDIKYKPYKYNFSHILNTKDLLCFDTICDSFVEIHNIYDKDIIFTEELFEFNTYEKDVIDAYNKLDYIDISFKLLNTDNSRINNLINDDMRSNLIIERHHEHPLEKIRIRYCENIINELNKANKKNIDYLNYSKNYMDYIKLTEENKKEFKKLNRKML